MANQNYIVQGNNGSVLSFAISDGTKPIDLTNATVQVTLTNSNHIGFVRQAEITDSINGKCQIALTSDDVQFDGTYIFQPTVYFSDGRQFTSSTIQKFVVAKKLGFIPGSGGGSGSSTNILPAGINGHILVNGNDIKVYDDTSINNKVNTIVSQSTTNGNIVFNGNEVKVYDDTNVNNQITGIKDSDVYKRVGIDSNNKLTVDGVEVVGSSSGDTILQSQINGNIKVNGVELKVYNDSSIQTNLTTLNSEAHTHTNKTVLDQISSNGNNLLFNGTQVNTQVQASVTNGHITVNGADIKVYDDTSLTQALAGKVDTTHQYSLSDLLDVDTLNKINGYALIYDSTTGKFTSQPLPSSSGGSGSTVAHSSINGNILIDGNETNVYDDTTIKSEIGTLPNLQTTAKSDVVSAVNEVFSTLSDYLPLLKRLGIDSNGNLTVDGKIVGSSTNTAPSISSSYNTTSVNDSTSVSIPYTITDAEGGSLTATYSIDGSISTATVSVGSNTWNVGTLSVGNHTLTIQVKDNGNLTSNTLTFNLTVSATNTAPSISSSYNTTSVYTTDNVSIPFTVTDTEGGAITANYNIDGSSSTSSISTGANNWSVGTLSAGSHTLTIQVTDNGGLASNILTFNITSSVASNTATVGSAVVGTSQVA